MISYVPGHQILLQLQLLSLQVQLVGRAGVAPWILIQLIGRIGWIKAACFLLTNLNAKFADLNLRARLGALKLDQICIVHFRFGFKRLIKKGIKVQVRIMLQPASLLKR